MSVGDCVRLPVNEEPHTLSELIETRQGCMGPHFRNDQLCILFCNQMMLIYASVPQIDSINGFIHLHCTFISVGPCPRSVNLHYCLISVCPPQCLVHFCDIFNSIHLGQSYRVQLDRGGSGSYIFLAQLLLGPLYEAHLCSFIPQFLIPRPKGT